MTTDRTQTADELAAEYAAEVAAIDAAHRPPPATLTQDMGLRGNWQGIGAWIRDRRAAYVKHRDRLAALTHASEDRPQ